MSCACFCIPAGAQLRGVNVAGAEFGENQIPGVMNRDYTYASEATMRYFAARNLGMIRFPIMWERIQPQLGGPLDPANLAALKRVAAWNRAAGNRLIIDVHNYGRYKINEGGKLTAHVIGGDRVTGAHLADLWGRLSAEFRDEPAVYAYGLMNEPHDLGAADWRAISQQVLSAIRAARDDKLILVPGDSWSSANRWPRVHGSAAWIRDPADNFAYEAHLYFDRDESGTYARSYDDELKDDPDLANAGARRLANFVSWCRANNARGFLGEFGVPADPRWLAVLDRFLAALDASGFDGAYWAAGEWWGNYQLSVQPQSSFTQDRPQIYVLLGHIPPGAFTCVSAASSGGYVFAPDSLVSGYGLGLPGATAEVELTDAAGTVRRAQLLYSSATRINFVVPPDIESGRVSVAVISGGNAAARGVLYVDKVAPTLFPVAQVLRVAADGSRTLQTVGSDDAIDLGGPAGRAFLTLYATGLRGAASVTLEIGGVAIPPDYAGAQGPFPGLDQVNAELPPSLAGRGRVSVTFHADGKPANPLSLSFR